MPGPRNAKKKKRVESQKEHRRRASQYSLDTTPAEVGHYRPLPSQPLRYSEASSPDSRRLESQLSNKLSTPKPDDALKNRGEDEGHEEDEGRRELYADCLPKPPCIENKGDGFFIRDVIEFIDSRFASAPSLEDPLCAEFAQDEVLDMLCTVLPEETAMMMWYNKSRLEARICPVCKRLYRVGDALRQPLRDGSCSGEGSPNKSTDKTASRERREQEISGICSSLCFFLSASQYPTALRSMWGRMAEELSDETWAELNRPPASSRRDLGLGLLLKMTRCHDLGLQELFFPGQDMEEHDEARSQDKPDVNEPCTYYS